MKVMTLVCLQEGNSGVFLLCCIAVLVTGSCCRSVGHLVRIIEVRNHTGSDFLFHSLFDCTVLGHFS